jgi:hypothetical protein
MQSLALVLPAEPAMRRSFALRTMVLTSSLLGCGTPEVVAERIGTVCADLSCALDGSEPAPSDVVPIGDYASAPSCVGACGLSLGDCACDVECLGRGDCCPDVLEACSFDEGACGGTCGGQSGACFCDALCFAAGDCCADHAAACDVPASSCEGACGGEAPSRACWCDAHCEAFGDCCADYGDACEQDCTSTSAGPGSDSGVLTGPADSTTSGGPITPADSTWGGASDGSDPSTTIDAGVDLGTGAPMEHDELALTARDAVAAGDEFVLELTIKKFNGKYYVQTYIKHVPSGGAAATEWLLLEAGDYTLTDGKLKLTEAGVAKAENAATRQGKQFASRIMKGGKFFTEGARCLIRGGATVVAVTFLFDGAALAGKYIPPLILPGTIDRLTDGTDDWSKAVRTMASFLNQRPPIGDNCGECYNNAAPGGITRNYILQVEAGTTQTHFRTLVNEYKKALANRYGTCAGKVGGRGTQGGWVGPDNPLNATCDSYCAQGC